MWERKKWMGDEKCAKQSAFVFRKRMRIREILAEAITFQTATSLLFLLLLLLFKMSIVCFLTVAYIRLGYKAHYYARNIWNLNVSFIRWFLSYFLYVVKIKGYVRFKSDVVTSSERTFRWFWNVKFRTIGNVVLHRKQKIDFKSTWWQINVQFEMRQKSVIDHIYLCEIKNDHSNYGKLKHFFHFQDSTQNTLIGVSVVAFHFLSIKRTTKWTIKSTQIILNAHHSHHLFYVHTLTKKNYVDTTNYIIYPNWTWSECQHKLFSVNESWGQIERKSEKHW